MKKIIVLICLICFNLSVFASMVSIRSVQKKEAAAKAVALKRAYGTPKKVMTRARLPNQDVLSYQ